MDYKKEIDRRDKKIEDLKREIKHKEEEISAMGELLDCAAANIVVLVKNVGKRAALSKTEIKEALGKFHLSAKDDGNGKYILEITEE